MYWLINLTVGFIQLAGGTNAQTMDSLKREGLFLAALPGQEAVIAGVAYGGYARKVSLSDLFFEHKYMSCFTFEGRTIS